MKTYVCGFAFGDDGKVALIQKARPDWQKGLLNGIGGHVEEGELLHDAMEREFLEETGARVSDWELFATIIAPGYNCHFYRAFDVSLEELRTTTDEEVFLVDAFALPENTIFNLRWLIPLAWDMEPQLPVELVY